MHPLLETLSGGIWTAISHGKGEDSVLADALSCQPTRHADTMQERLNLPKDDDDGFSFLADEELLECFLNHPDPMQIRNPLNLGYMIYQPTLDLELHQQLVNNP